MIAELQRRLNRLELQLEKLRAKHDGNEEKFTYWAGFDVGYICGKIHEIEDIIDDHETKYKLNQQSSN